MRFCSRVPPPLPAAFPGAFGQLSASRCCSPGVPCCMSRLGGGWRPAAQRNLNCLPRELSYVRVSKYSDACVCLPRCESVNVWSGVCLFFLKNLMPGIWIFGIFFVGGGGLGWWQVLLETWRKLAALPFFSSQRSKPGTSRVAGETKAQSIAFINKEN